MTAMEFVIIALSALSVAQVFVLILLLEILYRLRQILHLLCE
jgi:hypothetical protein